MNTCIFKRWSNTHWKKTWKSRRGNYSFMYSPRSSTLTSSQRQNTGSRPSSSSVNSSARHRLNWKTVVSWISLDGRWLYWIHACTLTEKSGKHALHLLVEDGCIRDITVLFTNGNGNIKSNVQEDCIEICFQILKF